MDTPLHGFAALLRSALGARWQFLHPDTRARFTLAPGATQQSFTGIMDEIDRSAIGWAIARLIAFVHVLPSVRARDVPFEFNLSPAASLVPASGWIKERLYHFRHGNNSRFEFRSVMRIANNGELIEQFPYGLGMKIKLAAGDDTLYFLDDGYFLRMGAWRLPLPRWLTVGRFVLTHKNIDRDHFTIEINLEHPLLGRLFHQHGRFRQSPPVSVCKAQPAALSVPDTACAASIETVYC